LIQGRNPQALPRLGVLFWQLRARIRPAPRLVCSAALTVRRLAIMGYAAFRAPRSSVKLNRTLGGSEGQGRSSLAPDNEQKGRRRRQIATSVEVRQLPDPTTKAAAQVLGGVAVALLGPDLSLEELGGGS
jgi:hypothetical protein